MPKTSQANNDHVSNLDLSDAQDRNKRLKIIRALRLYWEACGEFESVAAEDGISQTTPHELRYGMATGLICSKVSVAMVTGRAETAE